MQLLAAGPTRGVPPESGAKPPHPDDFDERDRPIMLLDLRDFTIVLASDRDLRRPEAG